MIRFIGGSIGTALIVALTSATAWAQATAQMSGTVRDSSGGVLPGHESVSPGRSRPARTHRPAALSLWLGVATSSSPPSAWIARSSRGP